MTGGMTDARASVMIGKRSIEDSRAGVRWELDAAARDQVVRVADRYGTTPACVLAATLAVLAARLDELADASVRVGPAELHLPVSPDESFEHLVRRVTAQREDRSLRGPQSQAKTGTAQREDRSLRGPQSQADDTGELAGAPTWEPVTLGWPPGAATPPGPVVASWRAMLAAAIAGPTRRLGELPVLDGDGYRTLVVAANATDRSWPLDRCLHDLVAQWARRTPTGPALRYGERVVSYAELAAAAAALAAVVRERLSGRPAPVGVCCDEPVGLVTAMLAVFQAGASYLPLDPSHPPARLGDLLADAGARLVLTTPDRAGDFAGYPIELLPGTVTPVLDAVPPREAVTGGEPPPTLPAVDPEAIAYIIYTSGSTGRPKGVAVAHRGLTNLAYAQGEVIGPAPGMRVLQFSAPCFDASIFDVVMALAHGATLCLADRADLLPGEPLAATLDRLRINQVTLPPTCLAAIGQRQLPELRVIAVAGEACPVELVRAWAPGRLMFNLYGPTETSIWTTAQECVADGRPPPIGRPIGNVTAYVLDRWGHPVPAGVAGELYIGGAGVAAGYVGRPELTAERFVADRFGGTGRLYRTGDRARWRASDAGHVLEFLGRVDDQVKIRGVRIEPGEVRAAVVEHPAVADCTVVARSDHAAGEASLTAYLVPRDGPVPVEELRTYVGARLPAPMVPAAFVWLDALPIGPTGKLDRSALPAPPAQRTGLRTAYRKPRDRVQQRIAEIFATALGVEAVGTDDDFFALGGHSVLAVRVAAEAARALGVPLSPQAVFDERTPARLAERAIELLMDQIGEGEPDDDR
jgi:amino acid adenylation domain-containing protein